MADTFPALQITSNWRRSHQGR